VESYDYPADCRGLWTWPKQWFPTSHGFLQTGAEPVMVKLKTMRKGSALS